MHSSFIFSLDIEGHYIGGEGSVVVLVSQPGSQPAASLQESRLQSLTLDPDFSNEADFQ